MGRLSLVYTSRRRMESSHSRAAWLNSTYTHTHREKDGRETTTMTTAPSCVYSFPAFCFFFLLLFSHLFIAESCRRGNKKEKSLSFFCCVFGVFLLYIYFLSLLAVMSRHFGELLGLSSWALVSCELSWEAWAVEFSPLLFPSSSLFVFRGGFLRGWMEKKEKKKKKGRDGRAVGWMDGWRKSGGSAPPRIRLAAHIDPHG